MELKEVLEMALAMRAQIAENDMNRSKDYGVDPAQQEALNALYKLAAKQARVAMNALPEVSVQ